MPQYHLEVLDGSCTNSKLLIFGRAHLSYINQIFGDLTVREIIQEVWGKPGKLVVTASNASFESSFHHTYQSHKNRPSTAVCSVDEGYQDLSVDVNDTLCQSYSLMNYLKIPFDKTKSKKASVAVKKSRQMVMIQMYRMILDTPEFISKLSDEIISNKDNNELWTDFVDDSNTFSIIKKYKNKIDPILENIRTVLTIWESYGWAYFVGKGTCT